MGRPKDFYIQLDTETCGALDSPLVYDLGMIVIDRHGTIYEQYNFVIYDVYVGMRDLMQTAYYADKLPQYEEELKKGIRQMIRWRTAFYTIRKLIKKYNIKAVIAHNARFDNNALNNTNKILGGYGRVVPYGIDIWCTLRMAQQTVAKLKKYKKYCKEHNYLTKRGQVRLTAEILYRYFTGDETFNEAHTGLQDVFCERVIFINILAFHKAMVRTYYNKR